MNDAEIVFPTGCFYYGLWIGSRLLAVTKDLLVVSELIKSLVFSCQRFLQQATYQSIVVSFLPQFSRLPDLSQTIYNLLQKESKESVESFCKSKEAVDDAKLVDQAQLVFVELQHTATKRADKAFHEQTDQRESSLRDHFLRFEGRKDSNMLLYENSNRTTHSEKILRARHAQEQQLNLNRLHQLIFRIRCNESSVWFRESSY